MTTHRILCRSVATLLALAPLALHAGTQTITAFGDPTDGTQGVNPSWGIGANWTGTNGATVPGVNDLAQINSDDFSTTAVDLRGSDFPLVAGAGFTEVQGISFIGTSFADVILENNSTDTNMVLALNGGGGVPLIQTGNYAVQIVGVGQGVITPTANTLTLQLRGSGDVSVGGGGLTISAQITQNGGTFGFNKTGPGTLILSGAQSNTYAGTTTISEGLVIANKPSTPAVNVNAIGGNLVINAGGAFMYQGHNVGNQIVNTATITLNGGDFGDLAAGAPTNPGAPEIVASLIVNSGNFSTGRAAFTTTGLFSSTGGTSLVHRGGSLTVGSFTLSTNGVVNLDGGSTTAGAESKLTVGAGGVTFSGGTINFNTGQSGLATNSTGSILTIGGNVTATGTTNLVHANAGIVGPKANIELGAAARTFNVTGNLNIGAIGATVNVNGGNNAAGSIIKTGAGTLTINSTTSNLTGPVLVNAGTLAFSGTTTTVAPVTVASGAKLIATGTMPALMTLNGGSTLQAGTANGGGNISVANLKLGVNNGDTETLNLSSTSSIIVTQNNGLTTNGGAGTVTINILGAAPAVGVYPLIDYTGAIGGLSGQGAFKLGTLPSQRITAALLINSTNTTINLNVTGLDFPIWKGGLSSEWSTAVLGNPKNWVLNSNNATSTDYLLGDNVTFNDLATNTTVTTSVEDVSPSAITFANGVTKDYILNGTKSIAGNTGITKNGLGKLTINSTNTFTGTVAMNAGTVSVSTLTDVGTNGPLGAGTTLSFNGGTLEYTGAATSTNRLLTINASGGKLQHDVPLTLAGNINGTGTLTKQGTGTLVLTGTNTYVGTTINAGTVQVGEGGDTGSLGTGAVINNTAIVFNRSDVNLAVNGAISGPGTITQNGIGATTLGGTVANTYIGLTTINSGALFANKTPGVNAISGDLVINDGLFGYAGNNVSNQIADTSTVTLNGGIFGDPNTANPVNPGATDTVANVIVTGGQFNSGRNDTLANPFTITGVLNINGGTVLAQRGGGISAGTVQYSSGSLSLDGGSTTAGQESKLIVGNGGMTLTNNNVFLNAGPSTLVAGSVGSLVTLNGDLTSTGTSGFIRLDGGNVPARIDLGGGVRTFNVAGSLDIGGFGTPVNILNGGINKTGSGALNLNGRVTLSALTIGGTGVVTLGSHVGGPTAVNVIDTGALTFTGNQKLDITDNVLIVRNANYAAISAKILSGFNGGLWNGTGINSSSAATDPNSLTAIGSINNADAGFTDFAGVTGLTAADTIVKYTYYGDSDLNGVVNLDDFQLFLAGLQGALPPSWLSGDYDFNGVVNVDDFQLQLAAGQFGGPQLRNEDAAAQINALAQQLEGDGGALAGDDAAGGGGLAAAAGPAVVPEPGSIGLLAVGALGLLSRRRRR